MGDDEFVVKKKALLVAMEKARNVIRKAEKKALAASGISSKEKAGSAAAPKAAKNYQNDEEGMSTTIGFERSELPKTRFSQTPYLCLNSL